MPFDESIKNAQSGVALAGDNPNVKEAANKLGETALIITTTIKNVLLPLAAINFAFDKAHNYFSEKFPKDISDKTSFIPLEEIVEPKASIAGPALQGLAFTHEEANLKDMYLSLLATAMDGRVTEDAHPAFVEIIKQLTSEEANLIRDILRSPSPIAIAEIRVLKSGGSTWSTLATHVLGLTDVNTSLPVENPKCPAMVDNWTRLGLVEVDYSKQLNAEERYSWLDKRPEVLRFKQEHENETQKIGYAKGIINRTALGFQFAKAVGLL